MYISWEVSFTSKEKSANTYSPLINDIHAKGLGGDVYWLQFTLQNTENKQDSQINKEMNTWKAMHKVQYDVNGRIQMVLLQMFAVKCFQL